MEAPTKGLPYILISPTKDIPHTFCTQVGEAVGDFFGYPIQVAPLLQDIEFAYHSEREQYHSTLILESLAPLSPKQCVKILSITDQDLFIPILTHVYGEAQLGGKACIVSTHRLTSDLQISESTLLDRTVKESIHELGHTFNLRHCKDHTCIMHYCRSLEDVDMKSHRFCRYCEVLLSDEMKRDAYTT